MGSLLLKDIPGSEADTYIGPPRELVLVEPAGVPALRVHDGITPGGKSLGFDGSPVEVMQGLATADPLEKAAGYYRMRYEGPVLAGVNAPYMLMQAWSKMSGLERLLGYAGWHQWNSANADCEFVIATRQNAGGDPVIAYRISNLGVQNFQTDAVFAGNVTFNDSSKSTSFVQQVTFNNLTNVAGTNGRIAMAAERPIAFATNLIIRSKVGDTNTLQIDCVNARNFEVLTNNVVRFKIDSAGNILMPTLPTSAPATSGALWRDAANGNVLKVVP